VSGEAGTPATQTVEAPPAPEDHDTLAGALLAAQKVMPAVEPDKENGGFKESKYVTLGNLLSKVRPVLNQHGLLLIQAPRLKGEPAAFVLETTIQHAASGESFVFDTPLNAEKIGPQAQGSAITYMRRYTVASALAIADQEDDDANNATAAHITANAAAAPVARLRPERVESIISSFRDQRLSGKGINELLAAASAPTLALFTAEAISAHIGSLGEIEADALEAAVDQRENRDRLSDERIDQFMQGYTIASAELGGTTMENGHEIIDTPIDGLNILLGSLGFDALEVGAEGGVREQVALWPVEQVEAVEAEFAAAVDRAAAQAEGEDGSDEIPADAATGEEAEHVDA
jgi:hypothetical protein